RTPVQGQALHMASAESLALSVLSADGRRVRLSSGMAASAEIRTGDRRIIDFLLSPVARAADESLRER
ncbi:MAG: hypothetical protein ACREA9_18110, partial [Pyrinomonadaceae bacterium]